MALSPLLLPSPQLLPRASISLFSGLGGLDLGLKCALPDLRTVCYVEREAYCAASLVARMAETYLDPAPVWDQVDTFDGCPWRGKVDLVAGGYPCPPFSCAGLRLGDQDERHLWPEFARIIREVQPRWVFLENVAGHVSLGFPEVLGELAAMGFDAEWGVFSCGQVGATHERKRLFALAGFQGGGLADSDCGDARQPGRGSGESGARAAFSGEGRTELENPQHKEYGQRQRQFGEPHPASAELADADNQRQEQTSRAQGRESHGSGQKLGLSGGSGLPVRADDRRLPEQPTPPRDGSRLVPGRGLPFWALDRLDDWTGVPYPLWPVVVDPATVEPNLRGVAHGLPAGLVGGNERGGRGFRVRGLGNGASPAVVAVAFVTLWRRLLW